MKTFRDAWEECCDGMCYDSSIPEDQLEAILLRELEKSTKLAPEIAHYHRVGETHRDHSYHFLLYSVLDGHIGRELEKYNRVRKEQAWVDKNAKKEAAAAAAGQPAPAGAPKGYPAKGQGRRWLVRR